MAESFVEEPMPEEEIEDEPITPDKNTLGALLEAETKGDASFMQEPLQDQSFFEPQRIIPLTVSVDLPSTAAASGPSSFSSAEFRVSPSVKNVPATPQSVVVSSSPLISPAVPTASPAVPQQPPQTSPKSSVDSQHDLFAKENLAQFGYRGELHTDASIASLLRRSTISS